MSDIFNYAVSQVNRSRRAFCRFITANDVNLTSHQAGFYVPKEAESLLFDVPGGTWFKQRSICQDSLAG